MSSKQFKLVKISQSKIEKYYIKNRDKAVRTLSRLFLPNTHIGCCIKPHLRGAAITLQLRHIITSKLLK